MKFCFVFFLFVGRDEVWDPDKTRREAESNNFVLGVMVGVN